MCTVKSEWRGVKSEWCVYSEDGRVRSTQTLVINQWAGPSVIAKLAPDSTPDRAE